MKTYLRIILLNSAFCILHSASSFSQTPGEWIWLSGDSTANNAAVFGTQGVPSVNNHPPADYEYVEWKDKQGNFWVYDGWAGYSDLWKYNPSTNEWTWVKGPGGYGPTVYGTLGVPSVNNSPGNRISGLPTWVDTSGNLWLFGGGFQNDLWRYEIATNEWTWMGGPQGYNGWGTHGTQGVPSTSNIPGARVECTSAWTDSLNNLWMFGGNGFDDNGNSGLLNDMMKYNIGTNEWTWMSGSSGTNAASNYGTKGVASATNVPGGRWSHAKWKYKLGNFWILGSYTTTSMNDLWRFDTGTNEWTWMGGPTVTNDAGVYQTTCVFDSINYPRSRFEHRSAVTDQCGRFWLFGGAIFNAGGFLNDLWVFDPMTNQWNWVNGTNVVDQMGNYGTKGISAPTNSPSSRIGADAWWGDDHRFYIFGGSRSPWSSYLSDLWVFTPDSSCSGLCSPQLPNAIFTAPNHICPGTCTDFTNLSTGASSYVWNFPGGNPSVSTDVSPTNICYTNTGNYSVTLIASNGNTSDTLTMNNYIIVFPSPPAQGIIQNGDTLIANQGSNSYQWFYNGNIISGATDYFYVAPQSGNYSVVATDENNCEVEAVINNVVAAVGSGSMQSIQIYPNPVTDKMTIQKSQVTRGTAIELSVYNVLGEKVYTAEYNSPTDGEPLIINCEDFPTGTYSLEIISNEKIYRTKFLKQ